MSQTSEDEIRWRAERAEGYLLLGMAQAARSELESLPAADRALPALREAWLQVAMAEKDWPNAAARAAQLRAERSAQPEFWVWEAFARRRAEGVPAARALLEQARARFPDCAIIPFNLACYACVEGDLEQARGLLRAVFRRTPSAVDMAAEDEDLRPLWSELDLLSAPGK